MVETRKKLLVRRPRPSPRLTSLTSCLITAEEEANLNIQLRPKIHTVHNTTSRGAWEPNYHSINGPNSPDPLLVYNKSSSISAFFHIVCVMAGTGILQLPYALKLGGILGIIWIVISGILAYFSGKFLVNCLYFDGLNGVIEIGARALGPNGRRLTEFAYFTLIIGASGLYMILATNNLTLIDQWTGWKQREWVVVCFLVSCIPFITIKSLKEATYLSLFGVTTTVAMVLVIVVVSFQDYHRAGSEASKSHDLEYRWVNWTYMPLSLASISFSFGGNSVFPHVEKAMQDSKQFNSVLKYALSFITFIYCLVAAVGYLAYAQFTTSPIFNNLHKGDAVLIAIAMLTLHVLVTIPINLTALALDAEFALGFTSPELSSGQQMAYRYAFRIFLSLLTFALAVFVPYFRHVMALLGALSNAILVFIMPPIFYVKLFGWRNVNRLDRVMVISLLVVGSFVVIVGTVQSAIALWHDINPN